MNTHTPKEKGTENWAQLLSNSLGKAVDVWFSCRLKQQEHAASEEPRMPVWLYNTHTLLSFSLYAICAFHRVQGYLGVFLKVYICVRLYTASVQICKTHCMQFHCNDEQSKQQVLYCLFHRLLFNTDALICPQYCQRAKYCQKDKLCSVLHKQILHVLQLFWLNEHNRHINLSGDLFKNKQTLFFFLPFLDLIIFQLQDLKVLEALMLTLSTQILKIEQTTLHLLKVSLQMSCAKTLKTNKFYTLVEESN